MEVALSCPNVASKQKKKTKNKNKNKNEQTEYHGISIPFKSQVYSKRESYFSLVWVMERLVKEKVFSENSSLPNLIDIQR